MKHLVWIALAIFILIILAAAGGYWLGRSSSSVKSDNSLGDEISMEYKSITFNGITEDEQKQIIEFTDTFERAIAQRDSDKVLSFFSAPETDKEQDELNFVLGADMARVGVKSAKRLFITAGFNFRYGAHYVRSVSAQGANRRVLVDELRILPSGGEWVGYTARVSHLILDLEKTDHGYKVDKYNHSELPPDSTRKYEGFIAE